MKKLVSWVGSIFNDETGSPSSKRVVGVMCAMALCVTMYHNSFSPKDQAPSADLVDAVAMLAFGCLGLASVDKLTARFGKNKPEDAKEE